MDFPDYPGHSEPCSTGLRRVNDAVAQAGERKIYPGGWVVTPLHYVSWGDSEATTCNGNAGGTLTVISQSYNICDVCV